MLGRLPGSGQGRSGCHVHLRLSGVSLATLVSAFESLGQGAAGWSEPALLLAVGLATGWLYVLHARRTPHPIIDLALLRTPTFAISVLGGNLCRFAVGAMPFLLAMLLQVGFGLSPFQAGLITFASAAGSLLMKFVATPIVQRYGFRRVLTVNALLTGGHMPLDPVCLVRAHVVDAYTIARRHASTWSAAAGSWPSWPT